jgi:hypothetical protein
LTSAIVLWFIGGVCCGLLGRSVSKRADDTARVAALIRDVRTTKVEGLRPGLAEVAGRIRAVDSHPLLQAPLSGRPCVYYCFEVQESAGAIKKTHEQAWRSRVRDVARSAFVLDDGTGTVQVELEGAAVGLAADTGGESGFMTEWTPAFAAALKRYNVTTSGFAMNRTYRYRETVLCVDDPLYALGTFTGKAIEKGPDGVLIVADRNEAAVQALHDADVRLDRSVARALFAAAVVLPIIGVLFIVRG